MNIKTNKNNGILLENLDEKANRLIESYNRSRSKAQFLRENGNTIENQILYNFMGLNESVSNSSLQFHFENGMYIPSIDSKVTGRLSLPTIFENSKNENEFVENVSHMICEDKLMFTPSENDVNSLKEAYINYKKTTKLND